MSREIAERCDLCGEYRAHGDLVTVHALGEPVDVCRDCQAQPVGKVLSVAHSLAAKNAEGPAEGIEVLP